MKSMNAERFYDLAFKSILKQATSEELGELQAALDEDPALVSELTQLQTQAFSLRELLSLLDATDATGPKPSEAAREQVRARIRKWFESNRKGGEVRTRSHRRFLILLMVFEFLSSAIVMYFCQRRQTHGIWPFNSTTMSTNWNLFVPWMIVASAASYFAASKIARRK